MSSFCSTMPDFFPLQFSLTCTQILLQDLHRVGQLAGSFASLIPIHSFHRHHHPSTSTTTTSLFYSRVTCQVMVQQIINSLPVARLGGAPSQAQVLPTPLSQKQIIGDQIHQIGRYRWMVPVVPHNVHSLLVRLRLDPRKLNPSLHFDPSRCNRTSTCGL